MSRHATSWEGVTQGMDKATVTSTVSALTNLFQPLPRFVFVGGVLDHMRLFGYNERSPYEAAKGLVESLGAQVNTLDFTSSGKNKPKPTSTYYDTSVLADQW